MSEDANLINQIIKLKMENAELKTKQDKLVFENKIMKEYLQGRWINIITDKSNQIYTIDKDQNINKLHIPLKHYANSSSENWGFAGLGG